MYSINSTLADYVDAGDVLAEIHSMELVDAQLSLIQTAVRLRFTEEQVEFIRGLAVNQVSSRKELLRIEAELRELESRFESLRRTLRLMGLQDQVIDNVLKTKQVAPVVSIRAPISGYVTKQSVSIGRVVDAGEPLYEITDISIVSVEAALFAQDVPHVLDGNEVKPIIIRTVAYPDREWLAKIEIFHPSFAGNDKTLRVWTDLKNEDLALLPGLRPDFPQHPGADTSAGALGPGHIIISGTAV
ncbi:MAG: efflux RND transporter periplasmic adaptor subunit [Chloroflexi bacterium]|nr:efflux RND transporter periplasmic adaptor subunit [Chloroflexota bacterium]